MPRAPWQRRRATDSPRPAGRRWAGRLRRSGSLARQVLLTGRVARSHGESGAALRDRDAVRLPRLRVLRRGATSRDITTITPTGLVDGVHFPPRPEAKPQIDAEPAGLSIPLLPGDRTIARRIRFALVNACTLSSLVLGLSAIFVAVRHGDVRIAAGLLIACVAFDGVDGALARKLGVASPFGAQMDSLADMCSFGLAAPVVVYAWLAGTTNTMVLIPACALVAVCACVRLARFNVSPKDGRFFCGVPTTMCAAVLALSALISPSMPAGLRIAGVALLGLAMVSSFPYAKLARLLRLPPWLLLLPVIGAILDYQLTFVAVVLAYLVSGPLLWLRQRKLAAV